VLECVVNVSEGRDMRCLRALAAAAGKALLDVHADADHHRSVFTLGGTGQTDLDASVRAVAGRVAEYVSINEHEGEHPRLGALDVVPFVALGGTNAERAVAADAARAFGEWWATTHDVPVFFYDDADAQHRDLPYLRRHAFRSRRPDVGPEQPHPRLGATAVGARKPLVAVNCVLVSRNVDVARRIARRMREANGGPRGVRALGFMLAAQNRAQVSMNLIDLDRTGLQDACLHVRELARAEHTDIAAVELVGLVPARELDRCTDEFLVWSGLDAASTIEARIEGGPRWLPGDPFPAGTR
jgi:glutamate formiminotransferase